MSCSICLHHSHDAVQKRTQVYGDEVRLRLTTSRMPTNSTGFWVSYRTSTVSSPIAESDVACDSPLEREVTEASGCISFNMRQISGDPAQIWGIPPNGKGVWVIRPDGAQSITLFPPNIFFEKGYDWMRIYSCNGGTCTQMYKNMTGKVPFTNSYCDIYRKTSEVRVEVSFDGTNNMDSYFTDLCYSSSQTVDATKNETTGNECDLEPPLNTASGSITAEVTPPEQQQTGVDKPKVRTWVISPGADTKSITLTFSKFGPTWDQAVMVSWDDQEHTMTYVRPSDFDWYNLLGEGFDMWGLGDTMEPPCRGTENAPFKYECYLQMCAAYQKLYATEGYSWPCYIPMPHISTMVIPASKVFVRLFPAPYLEDYPGNVPASKGPSANFGLQATYTSSKVAPAPPLQDGDPRFNVPSARTVLSKPSGSISFDVRKWMAENKAVNSSVGFTVPPSRVQWVIRPSNLTKQITISFDYLDLSPADYIDMLYIVRDCNSLVERSWLFTVDTEVKIGTGTDVYVLNGFSTENNNFQYKPGEVPCDATFETSCLAVEYDFSMRYANPSLYAEQYMGFGLKYTSSGDVPTNALQWEPYAALQSCTPSFAKATDAPSLVMNELCCTNDPGNEVFGSAFFANVSIDPKIPAGEDPENFKVIYKVEAYYQGPSTLNSEVKCEQTYFESLSGWYPSEARKVDLSTYADAGSDQCYSANICGKDESVDLDMILKNWKVANPKREFPSEFIPGGSSASSSAAKLWYTSNKLVQVRGKMELVGPTPILLSPLKPTSDRPRFESSIADHVLISAVTCRKVTTGAQTVWVKSAVAQTDIVLGTGPSITVTLTLPSVSNSVLNYAPSLSQDQQVAQSQPLIRQIVQQFADILGIKELYAGAAPKIQAIKVSVGPPIPTPSARRNYKTTVKSKPEYVEAGAAPSPGSKVPSYPANVTISILCTSIRQVSEFRTALSKASSRRQLLGLGALSFQVQVPTTTQKGRGGACLSHYDCLQTTTAGGLFCSKNKVCEVCRMCSVDNLDAVDGKCPRELCPLSGGFPECVNAKALISASLPCKMKYDFEVWKYTQPAPDGKYTKPEVSAPSFYMFLLLAFVCVCVHMCVCKIYLWCTRMQAACFHVQNIYI